MNIILQFAEPAQPSTGELLLSEDEAHHAIEFPQTNSDLAGHRTRTAQCDRRLRANPTGPRQRKYI